MTSTARSARGWATVALAAAALASPFALSAVATAQEPAKPRLLVLTFDKNDPDQRDMVQAIAEETLLNLGFPLVDSGQVRARYQLADLERFLLLTVELDRMSELRSRFAAEAIVIVQYTRQFRYEREFLGSKHRFFRDTVQVKVIEPDTAAVLHSSTGQGDIQARTTELERLTREGVQKAGDHLLATWKARTEGAPRPIQILAKGFDHDNLTRLENALKTVPGVLRVDRRDFGGPAVGAGNALVEVQADVSADDLSRFLNTLGNPPVKVISSTPQRIEVTLSQKLEIGFAEPKDGQTIAGASVRAVVRASARVSQLTVNGQPARSEDGGITWAADVALRSGPNLIDAAARDDLGRDALARITVTADAQPPQVRIVEPRSGFTVNRAARVVVEASDDGPGVTVTINGQPASVEGARWVADVQIQPGVTTIVAEARDQVGQTARDQVTLTLDTEPPVVRFVAPTESLTSRSLVRVEVDATDNAGPVAQVLLNGQPMQAVRPPSGFALELELPEGVHELIAVATDAAGLSASATHRIEVDVTPPRLEGTVIAIIEGKVEPGATVTLEGRPVPVNADGTFRITVEGTPGGSVTVVAVDAAGNRTERVYRIGGKPASAPQR